MIPVEVPPPPTIVRPHQPVRRGVCFHVDKPCFTIEPRKNTKKEIPFRKEYYVNRIKTMAKSAQDPDMNMSLNEIKTGVKTSDRVRLSLGVYLLGVLAIFMSVKK